LLTGPHAVVTTHEAGERERAISAAAATATTSTATTSAAIPSHAKGFLAAFAFAVAID
jgi:hypothetical protein